MKKIMIATACALLTVAGTHAQTVYDAAKLADKDLSGTARFVGMGGAMGALGGDISTISTNPAGIGIYRSNDVMTSFSFSAYGAESKYLGGTFNTDKNRFAYDNIGVVFAAKVGNQTPLRYVNFGFNYKRSKSFYKNMSMSGLMGSFEGQLLSQANFMAQQATSASRYVWDQFQEHLDYGANAIYKDDAAGWLGAMGVQGERLGTDKTSEKWNTYHPILPLDAESADILFDSKERGGINQYDFNVAFNISDRVYFGVTIGAYDVDYSKSSGYDEGYVNGNGKFNEDEGYLLESNNRIKGSGFDVKFGLIARPFESSPLRVGLAVHSPIFYNLTYKTNAMMFSDFLNDVGEKKNVAVDTYAALNNTDMAFEYKLQTPWTYNVSLGYTVGKSLAFGAEYEYEDYSTMKFFDMDGYDKEWETEEAKLTMQGQHTFRIGAEYKVIPQFAMRLGYNYISASFKDDAIKALPSNSVLTDTDFANVKSRNNYTLGVGYRGSLFYADLAYQFSTYKEDFYPFYNDINSYIVTPEATKVTNTRSQVLFTLGLRF